MSKNEKPVVNNTVTNNCITNTVWDKQAIEAVNNVSEALLNLTKLFQSQNITVNLISMDSSGATTTAKILNNNLQNNSSNTKDKIG